MDIETLWRVVNERLDPQATNVERGWCIDVGWADEDAGDAVSAEEEDEAINVVVAMIEGHRRHFSGSGRRVRESYGDIDQEQLIIDLESVAREAGNGSAGVWEPLYVGTVSLDGSPMVT